MPPWPGLKGIPLKRAESRNTIPRAESEVTRRSFLALPCEACPPRSRPSHVRHPCGSNSTARRRAWRSRRSWFRKSPPIMAAQISLGRPSRRTAKSCGGHGTTSLMPTGRCAPADRSSRQMSVCRFRGSRNALLRRRKTSQPPSYERRLSAMSATATSTW
jgi:hypothetical protein